MDPVTDVLQVSGVRGTFGSRIEAGQTWAAQGDAYRGAAMHAVTEGSAWLVIAGEEPHRLVEGDVVMVPDGTRHTLSDLPAPAPETHDPAVGRSRSIGGVTSLGSAPVRTRIVSIYYHCDHDARTQVLEALPALVHVNAWRRPTPLGDAVRMLNGELARPQIATAAVLDALVNIMLIQLLRAWLPAQPADRRGTWLGMLDDPVVRCALECIHREPARPWTTATLASAVAVSRATLSRRFPAAIGTTPTAYLTQWRMDRAGAQLRDTEDSLETVAASAGYGSVPAFSRAFARARGRAPGAYRKQVRGRRPSLAEAASTLEDEAPRPA